MKDKKLLVLDNDKQFCYLLCNFFYKKALECHYSNTLLEALAIVKSERPDIILADKNFHQNLQSSLHNIINSSDNYDPDVLLYDGNATSANMIDEVTKLFFD